ncbi:coiled-coil domain-containing protein 93-like isoform X5 [Montipora capricornis]|uniref:coiled-coil domain-containing protein 93-like isoform X5 n=1 Tax=Montipora capricornis TaxID=246305 RepID=UPI0035F21A00
MKKQEFEQHFWSMVASRVTREFGGSRERTAGELVASLEKQIAVQEKKLEQERSELISKQYEADKVKLGKIRFFQARKNREISSLQRKIDKVPSRAELTQYQRRFLELYKHAKQQREIVKFEVLWRKSTLGGKCSS